MDLQPEQVLKMVEDITAQEHHFNKLEAEYRKLASQWLLAVFAGIGFVIKLESSSLPFEKAAFVALISLAGAIGIFLLWLIDLGVYHRLLDSAFMRGCELEKQYGWLPKARTGMIESVKGGDVTSTIVLYYSIMVAVLVLIAGVCLSYWASRLTGNNRTVFWAVMVASTCIAAFIFHHMGRKSKRIC
jgi:hypothetical protein